MKFHPSIFHVFFLVLFLSGPGPAAAAVNVSVCGTLDVDGETYTLTNDISGGECLIVGADNITINGNGHTITVLNGGDAGISNWNSVYNNINISNLHINLPDDSGSYGIDIENAKNIKINNIWFHGQGGFNLFYLINNTNVNITNINSNVIDVSGTLYDIEHNFNLMISNDTVYGNFHPIYSSELMYFDTNDLIYTDYNHSINGATVLDHIVLGLKGTGQSYRNGTNNLASFSFKSSDTVFNYRHNNNIVLDTNISIGYNGFDRISSSFTQSNITWNDNNASGNITAFYSLSGLYVNTNYSIYLNGVLDHNDITDGSGILPSFSIPLTNATNTIGVIAESVSSPTPTLTSTLIDRITGKIPSITNLIGVMIRPLLILSLVLFVLGMLEFLLGPLDSSLRFGR